MYEDAGKFLNLMIDIANKAVEVDELEIAAGIERKDLDAAYADHKRKNGLDHVERDTPEWEAMMTATNPEYQASQIAKRDLGNARRRLKTAIDRYRKTIMENRQRHAA